MTQHYDFTSLFPIDDLYSMAVSMNPGWYVLRSKPNKEDTLYQLVLSRGYEVYYPRLRVEPINPRSRSVRPFFPGYMFMYVDLEKEGVSAFKWLPYSYGLVTFGMESGQVPDSIISGLMKRIDGINARGIDPLREWKHGDALVIRDGVFEGFEAIFDTRITGQKRARILMKFLSGQWVKTEIDIRSLENRRLGSGL